jgi:hypothetical protein
LDRSVAERGREIASDVVPKPLHASLSTNWGNVSEQLIGEHGFSLDIGAAPSCHANSLGRTSPVKMTKCIRKLPCTHFG